MQPATTLARPLVLGPSLTRTGLVLGAGGLTLLVVAIAAVGLGSVPVQPGDVLAIVVRRLTGLPLPVTWPPTAETIIWELRLPRVLTAMLVGAGLACSGTVFQALLRNPLADPYIIGTAAGASLGAVSGLLLPLLMPSFAVAAAGGWLGLGLVQLLAFAGGLLTVLLVYRVAQGGGRASVVTLLLTGYAVSAVLAAVVALLMSLSGRTLSAIFGWLMGALAGASWGDLAMAGPLVAGAFAALLVRWRALNLLLLGERQAEYLGLEVEREKRRLTMLATLATSTVVAIAGTIGFVGLVVPHLLRLVVGPDHRLLLPASLLFGAALLAAADAAARLIGGVPVGVVTALIGAPFFLWLLRRSAVLAARDAGDAR